MSSAESRDDGRPVWFRSSYSNGAGGECVECALTNEDALVRDSKGSMGSVVTVRSETWNSFVQALRRGTIPLR
ncbi:hypothetical protein SSP24_73060 [Streptomyces spinoverrucosus]|uniref:DUF397 domain-containing protein n=1 Tax=Streptomyces spinoverrucosus TaxID=284043 RepID=A0A4Y3VV72_9ACTN|nr:DUF397 domain-containing protein [Streptomyces spinoverrucosus]GEC09651.1 hypothetical protein SSP24_73060 [Streptomyces spinoverrucosus]GHB70628.1 hypothetical protein GCM10010397_46150 [Streptomyces spinoverrucosus]